MTEKLSERVERLEGPDREIDVLICAKTGGVFHESISDQDAAQIAAKYSYTPDGEFEEVETSGADQWGVPHYTASLDAAMSLVPEGCSWNLSVGRVAIVQVTDCTGGPTVVPLDFDATAKTSAIALCAAALKSRGL